VKRSVALIAVAVLFAVGVAVGVLGMHLYYAREIARHGGGGDLGVQRFARHLDRVLDLNADQRRRIDEILEESRREGDALHREMLPRVREHMRRTADEVRAVLTPEQQARFDELQRRHRRRAEHFFLGRGRGRPGPFGPRRPRGPQPGPPPEPPPEP
jgi:Spy/CpxP family protein refolding chaperone